MNAPLNRSAALVLSVINCSSVGVCQIRLEIWLDFRRMAGFGFTQARAEQPYCPLYNIFSGSIRTQLGCSRKRCIHLVVKTVYHWYTVGHFFGISYMYILCSNLRYDIDLLIQFMATCLTYVLNNTLIICTKH